MTKQPDPLRERFDSLIAYVETWGDAGDGFIDTLKEARAALHVTDTGAGHADDVEGKP